MFNFGIVFLWGDMQMDLKQMKELFWLNSLVIPPMVLEYYSKIGLDEVELAVLLHILSETNDRLKSRDISIDGFENKMSLSVFQIKSVVARLIEKNILGITKDKHGNDVFSLEGLWTRLFEAWNAEKSLGNKTVKNNLVSDFENEIGRKLSPIETQKLKSWSEEGFSDELILAALERAVYQRVLSFKYIDSILFSWRKKGISTLNEVIENDRRFKNNKIKSTHNHFLKDNNNNGEPDKFEDIYVT